MTDPQMESLGDMYLAAKQLVKAIEAFQKCALSEPDTLSLSIGLAKDINFIASDLQENEL